MTSVNVKVIAYLNFFGCEEWLSSQRCTLLFPPNDFDPRLAFAQVGYLCNRQKRRTNLYAEKIDFDTRLAFAQEGYLCVLSMTKPRSGFTFPADERGAPELTLRIWLSAGAEVALA